MNLNNEIDDAGHFEHNVKVIRVKVLQEAVKKLKEERGNCYECGCSLTDEKIMEIFGDKLVEKGK